ncbi:hypothetical protein OHA61_10005 [Streptomyces sp. NBC_00885]|uniref:hypothetical protein n=1 Tax=Streptomyces sp. NBC_00885 TaxID=2975857 RepID=UPI00386F876A|nr:hypothetical protein OHA61_10005 [Streptomyces sp. NBC_00885]
MIVGRLQQLRGDAPKDRPALPVDVVGPSAQIERGQMKNEQAAPPRDFRKNKLELARTNIRWRNASINY